MLVLDHISFFQRHAIFYGFTLIVDFVKFIHEHISLTLLVLLLSLLGRGAIIEPRFLLLEILDLNLLLEEHNLKLLLQTVDVNFTLCKCSALIGVNKA